MSFKNKIDKLLSSNELGINSVYALEKYVGASVGSINKFYNEDRSPGRTIIKKIKKAFNLTDKTWEVGDFGKGEKEEGDVTDHPLVKSYVNQISQLNKLVEMLERENGELRRRK